MVVMQRRENDCLICCCAMYWDITYEAVVEITKDKLPEYYTIYQRNHLLPLSFAKRLALLFGQKDIGWRIYNSADIKKKSILGIPTGYKQVHCVFWDTVKVIDPASRDYLFSDALFVFQRKN